MGVIWVTRSEPGASVLGELLAEHGFDAWVAPVLEIEHLQPPTILVNGRAARDAQAALEPDPDVLIALSGHAVRGFFKGGFGERVAAVPMFAVGEQTATLLRARGWTAQAPSRETSEGLLAMPELAGVSQGATVWVLAGVAGRGVVERYLQDERHCRVVKFELYRRAAADVALNDAGEVDAVVLASADGVAAFARVWRSAGGRPGVPVVVSSSRVADAARREGFDSVSVARDASAQAAVAELERLCSGCER